MASLFQPILDTARGIAVAPDAARQSGVSGVLQALSNPSTFERGATVRSIADKNRPLIDAFDQALDAGDMQTATKTLLDLNQAISQNGQSPELAASILDPLKQKYSQKVFSGIDLSAKNAPEQVLSAGLSTGATKPEAASRTLANVLKARSSAGSSEAETGERGARQKLIEAKTQTEEDLRSPRVGSENALGASRIAQAGLRTEMMAGNVPSGGGGRSSLTEEDIDRLTPAIQRELTNVNQGFGSEDTLRTLLEVRNQRANILGAPPFTLIRQPGANGQPGSLSIQAASNQPAAGAPPPAQGGFRIGGQAPELAPMQAPPPQDVSLSQAGANQPLQRVTVDDVRRLVPQVAQALDQGQHVAKSQVRSALAAVGMTDPSQQDEAILMLQGAGQPPPTQTPGPTPAPSYAR